MYLKLPSQIGTYPAIYFLGHRKIAHMFFLGIRYKYTLLDKEDRANTGSQETLSSLEVILWEEQTQFQLLDLEGEVPIIALDQVP